GLFEVPQERSARRYRWQPASCPDHFDSRSHHIGPRADGRLAAAGGSAIHRIEERERGRLNGIGRNATAAVHAAFVFDFDRRFALRVFAARHAVNAEVTHNDLDAGDLFDRVEQGVERTIAAARGLAYVLAGALERHGNLRLAAAS